MINKYESIPHKDERFFRSEDVFWSGFNDVDFYIEDKNNVNLYQNILTRNFPDLKIQKVFTLEGKNNVLADAKVNFNNKKKIYIVDKDFDDLLFQFHYLPNLVYLDVFEAENLVIEEGAIIEYVLESNAHLNRSHVENKLDLNNFLENIREDLFYLHCLFFIVQKYYLQFKNTDCNIQDFCCQSKKYQLDEEKINNYKIKIYQRLISKEFFISIDYEIMMIKRNFTLDEIVSGKNFLNLIRSYVNYLFSTGDNVTNLTYRLVKNSSLRKFTFPQRCIQDKIKKDNT